MTDTVFNGITSPSVREVVERAVADPRAMTHSWLFTGPPGSGRTVAAKIFATALVCPQGGCGTCEQCRSAHTDSHPDIVWVRTEGSIIPVAQIREVVRQAATLPSVARRRVIIVEDADRLNEQAANALLKSVEEPSEHTVFILCAPSTDRHDIAITLRSRCRHVYVPTPSMEAVKSVLLSDAQLTLTEEQAHWAASVAGGHIGRARHLVREEKARAKRAAALKLPGMIYEPAGAYAFTAELVKRAEEEAVSSLAAVEAREIASLEASLGVGTKGRGAAKLMRGSKGQFDELEREHKRRRARQTADFLDLALIDVAGLYRDAMMLAVGAVVGAGADGVAPDGGADVSSAGGAAQDGKVQPVGGFQHPDMEGTSRELARRNSPEALLHCIDAVMECRETLNSGVNVPAVVALNALAGRLRECCSL
ncbi:DNA polymerase III subunit delta' [Corynebacterium sp. zg254]|uniref:DNA polymerase III subunit delta n=1 Tax=Corynebacterium zhongnanshanii TaxID=2768834 RepID=A0ABQ6VDZ8_9CORY|nr:MULTISPECIES: DNA polymerase III subunit delta' [Corynebacterium]KAB3522657.1 DNA polymerase III subunit delta' [Corynebacterium zhongnanshanii]MCR5914295.1 DNA polymerase III subunit delta' [Corynebacterium sp. zg254]